jgi:hypothetical protein
VTPCVLIVIVAHNTHLVLEGTGELREGAKQAGIELHLGGGGAFFEGALTERESVDFGRGHCAPQSAQGNRRAH